jgi:intracellular multiplication protein IcmM
MQRETWRLRKASKNFYVRTFRFTGSTLVFSLLLNLVLGVVVFYEYVHQPIRHYYATNGATPPTELTAMNQPNMSSKALLGGAPPMDNREKLIPK